MREICTSGSTRGELVAPSVSLSRLHRLGAKIQVRAHTVNPRHTLDLPTSRTFNHLPLAVNLHW